MSTIFHFWSMYGKGTIFPFWLTLCWVDVSLLFNLDIFYVQKILFTKFFQCCVEHLFLILWYLLITFTLPIFLQQIHFSKIMVSSEMLEAKIFENPKLNKNWSTIVNQRGQKVKAKPSKLHISKRQKAKRI